MNRTKTAMAATYVQVSRDDLESWLDSLHLPKHWKRKEGMAGIYLLPLSDSVAIKLSSTIGSRDDAMGRGNASMNLALISLVTGMVLNKKAMGQSHFNRTTNWRKTWAEGVKRIEEAYLKGKGFYEALALIKDRDRYKDDTLNLIESVPGWQTNTMLSDFHGNVQRGGILTEKQMAVVQTATRKAPAQSAGPAPEAPTVDEALLARLRQLYVKARADNDTYLMDFAKTVGLKVKAGGTLSSAQEAFMLKSLGKYRLASRVARRFILGR